MPARSPEANFKEGIIKGFVMDDERLKQGGTVFGRDYFEELLERIREIRSSERRFYQKVTDIYALSVDYEQKTASLKIRISQRFPANSGGWSVTG